MLDAVLGRDTSVRGTISKGRFVQGAQHPKIFGWGHINPTPLQFLFLCIVPDFVVFPFLKVSLSFSFIFWPGRTSAGISRSYSFTEGVCTSFFKSSWMFVFHSFSLILEFRLRTITRAPIFKIWHLEQS